MKETRNAFRLMIVAAAITLAAIGVAACGSSDSDSDGGSDSGSADLAKYEQALKDAKAPVKWDGPTEPAPAPSGIKMTVVTCTQELEGCKLNAQGAVNAAKAVGWETNIINVTDPTRYDQAVQSAISQGADGIVLIGVDARLIAGGIEAAHNEDVPLVSVFQYNTPGPDSVDVEVSPDADFIGKTLADAMIVNEEGNVHLQMLAASEFSLPVNVLRAAKEELEACDVCDVTFAPEIKFTADTVTTTLPGRVVSALRQEPDINSLLIGFDPPTTQIVPAINSAGGLDDQVKLYSQLGTTSALNFLRDENVLVADVATSNEWGSWAGVDQMIRLLNGQETVDENLPSILLTSDSEELPPPGKPFTGDYAKFKEHYLELWE